MMISLSILSFLISIKFVLIHSPYAHLHIFYTDPDSLLLFIGNFALYSAAGTKSGSVIYFELEPDCELGNHTDSAEEIIYVVDGDIEATIGKERDRISKGELGVVPVMESHNFRNVGSSTARVIGFFSSPNIVSTFEKVFMPLKFKEFDTTKLPAPKMKS